VATGQKGISITWQENSSLYSTIIGKIHLVNKMKGTLSFLFLSFLVVFALISCKNESAEPKSYPVIYESENVYDSILAKQFGADEYGMKQYVMAFLNEGPNRNQDSLEEERLQRAHMDKINRLAEEGKLIIAGPFMDDFKTRGIYIFNVTTIKEAEELTATDPAIKAGRLTMELHPWYGPAGLMALDSIQKKITKKEI